MRGGRATSCKSIRTDLRNAGATVLDEPVVVDAGIVASRVPQDLDAFSARTIRGDRRGSAWFGARRLGRLTAAFPRRFFLRV
ncbi:MAG: DJ-1/PfpI family protein, partial [Dongiaceae bacterium]